MVAEYFPVILLLLQSLQLNCDIFTVRKVYPKPFDQRPLITIDYYASIIMREHFT